MKYRENETGLGSESTKNKQNRVLSQPFVVEIPKVPDGSCRGQTLAKLLKFSCSWPHPDGAGTFLREKSESPKLFSMLACADCQSIECESRAYGEVMEREEQTSF